MYLLHGIHPHTRPIDLDLVSVHGSVGDQDLGVLYALGLPHADLFVQDEAFIQERLLDRKVSRISHDPRPRRSKLFIGATPLSHYSIDSAPLQHRFGGRAAHKSALLTSSEG